MTAVPRSTVRGAQGAKGSTNDAANFVCKWHDRDDDD
jgi:hypothetical protein